MNTSHNIKFTYNGSIDSTNSDGFKEFYKNLCGNQNIGDPECSNNIAEMNLKDSFGDTILVIQDHFFYEN